MNYHVEFKKKKIKIICRYIFGYKYGVTLCKCSVDFLVPINQVE